MKLRELKTWEQELLRQQEEVGSMLEPLLKRREDLRAKLELVQRLIALEHDDGARADRPASQHGTAGAEIQGAVAAILSERGGAMHISDIRAALLERGMPIPGKGTDANIIVHLRRAPNLFIKRGRGTYALKAHRKSVEDG